VRTAAVREPVSLGYPALAEVVRRIVDASHPDRIILFGSAARGEVGPDSDSDLLVVKAGVPHRRRFAQDIHMRLSGVGASVDLIVMTPEDIKALRDDVGSVVPTVLREGVLVYAA